MIIDSAGSYDFATELALQADGRIIVAGARAGANGSDFALAGLNKDESTGTLTWTSDDVAPSFITVPIADYNRR